MYFIDYTAGWKTIVLIRGYLNIFISVLKLGGETGGKETTGET